MVRATSCCCTCGRCARQLLERLEHQAVGRGAETGLCRRGERGTARSAARRCAAPVPPRPLAATGCSAGGAQSCPRCQRDYRLPPDSSGQQRRKQRHKAALGRCVVAGHEPGADAGAGEAHRDQHQPVVTRPEGHGIVVADHDEQHRQREIGVVHRALLAAQTRSGIRSRGPAACARTSSRWPGMITNSTFATMMVPSADAEHHECAAAAEQLAQSPGLQPQQQGRRHDGQRRGACARAASGTARRRPASCRRVQPTAMRDRHRLGQQPHRGIDRDRHRPAGNTAGTAARSPTARWCRPPSRTSAGSAAAPPAPPGTCAPGKSRRHAPPTARRRHPASPSGVLGRLQMIVQPDEVERGSRSRRCRR